MCEQNQKFRLKPVAELLDGAHHFYIPSYQRGYRWDKTQVEDLLKDIWDFAINDEKKKDDFYCLQPIVVKKQDNSWIVIDGQQRLTTLLLLLNYIKKDSRTKFVVNSQMYTIKYHTRNEMNFQDPDKYADIDSFYIYQANNIIKNWFDRNPNIDFCTLERVLFNPSDNIAQVKVIWYVAESEKDIDSIKIFNNLNKGKIKLTNAELIKALFVLKTQEYKNGKKVEELNIGELAYEWNEIENRLQDNKLWYFLCNKDYNPATRIDIIFDLIAATGTKDDDDFSYRKFQDLFDRPDDPYWEKIKITNFTQAWKKVKEVYQTFIYWFENNDIYHYAGYLINYEVSIRDIYQKCQITTKSETKELLQGLIKVKLLNYAKANIDNFTYKDNHKECEKILLFFNIETLIGQNSKTANRESIGYNKFPFDLYKLNNWDIEHVSSQKDNTLKKVEDKIKWLSYIPCITCEDPTWDELKKEAAKLEDTLKEKGKDEEGQFKKLYDNILEIVQQEESINKDTLENLTLLDANTNRAYKNALYQTKRKTIIEKQMSGVFIPICTKNLFLKFYSSNDVGSSQWKNSWEKSDGEAYLKAIHDKIDYILQ